AGLNCADLHVDGAGERRASQLTAIGAMVTRQRSSRIDFEPNFAAETRPLDHAKEPRPGHNPAIVSVGTIAGCEVFHTCCRCTDAYLECDAAHESGADCMAPIASAFRSACSLSALTPGSPARSKPGAAGT